MEDLGPIVDQAGVHIWYLARRLDLSAIDRGGGGAHADEVVHVRFGEGNPAIPAI